jgi:hypothetical protein
MKITLQKNCLEKNRKEVTLYHTGCCCCCCCILTPIGNWLAESGVKSMTKHKQNLLLRFFINLIFAIGSALFGYLIFVIVANVSRFPYPEEHLTVPIVVSLATYYFLLWRNSWSWLKDVTLGRRYYVVFIEWLSSLLLMAVFCVASFFVSIVLLMQYK